MAYVYHGSPKRLKELQPRSEHEDPMVPEAVFASPSRSFALTYAGKKWSDKDFNQEVRSEDGKKQIIMREMRPNAIPETFEGAKGYLYHLPEDTFGRTERRGSTWEVISTKSVSPAKVERIKDVLQEIKQNPDIELAQYDPKSQQTVFAIQRSIRRMNEMENPAKYKEWVELHYLQF